MATTKITELTAATTIANTDILVVVTDPSGSPTTKKITANNLVNSLANATLRQLPYANSSANGTIKVGNNLTINATGHLSVNSNISVNSITATSKLQVGNSAGFAFNNSLIEIDGSANSYLQSVIQNANSGPDASGDLIITADSGNDTVDYVDFGINSSNYNNPDYSIGAGGDGYIYASNGNFTVGVLGVNKSLKLHAGGANPQSIKLTVNSSAVGINSSTSFIIGNSTANAVFTSNTIQTSNLTIQSNTFNIRSLDIVNTLATNYVQLHFNPDSSVDSGYANNSTWLYVQQNYIASEINSGTGTILSSTVLTDNNYTVSVNSSSWVFNSNSSITFPDSTVQNTAYTGLYTAANSSNWTNPAPTTIAAAIDRLAAVVKTLNGGTGA